MTIYLGILLALACAFTTNLGVPLQAPRRVRGARRPRPPPAALRARPVRARAGSPIGMLVADRRLGLPRRRAGARADVRRPGVLAGGVVLLAVMAERFFGFAVGPPPVGRARPHRARTRAARRHAARRPRRALAVLAARHDRLRGRPDRGRRAADHGHADRRARPSTTASCSAPPPASCSASPTSRSRRSPGSSARTALLGALLTPWTAHRRRRLGRRLLRLGEGPAGRRGGPGDRAHRRGRQRRRHRRRDHRLRRPACPAAPSGSWCRRSRSRS